MGTRTHTDWELLQEQDHPHACGDKLPLFRISLSLLGSSPRVWGQAALMVKALEYEGIIPTRVGTSSVGVFQDVNKGDHPHACGDKYYEFLCKMNAKGSSPRVWGQVGV